jgi:hypothetical protein
LVRQELFTPNLISQQTWTKKEIAKKNYLILIIKDVNVAYSQSEVTEALKKMLGENNVVCTYFPNLEVINPIVYKQYIRKSPKLLHMYAKFTPHPRSLDGTSPPSTDLLREFGFSEVNTALANAITTLNNSGTRTTTTSKPPTPNVTLEQVTTMIIKAKSKMKEYTAQMKDEAIIETHTYTDIVTEDLKEKLDSRFDQLMELLSCTRKVLRGTSPRATLGALEN